MCSLNPVGVSSHASLISRSGESTPLNVELVRLIICLNPKLVILQLFRLSLNLLEYRY